jgi:hypothetical protein
MPEPNEVKRAKLVEMLPDESDIKPGGKSVEVQFNPESLKVTYANQVAEKDKNGKQRGTPGLQFVGTSTSKLALQLWFDISRMPGGGEGAPADDVRRLTSEVAYFITPQKSPSDATKLTPPLVRFEWGSFQFTGVLDSLEETLDFFSHDGLPLRASLSVSLTGQPIRDLKYLSGVSGGAPPAPLGGGQRGPAGTTPFTPAAAGETVQSLSQNAGVPWQQIATANGIENPRQLAVGQLLNLRPN